MKTDAERLRAAMAILCEIIASPSVPNGLRNLAAAWCQEHQDAARLRRAPLVADLITPEDVQRHDRIQIEIEAVAAEHNAYLSRREGHS
ncbi:MAG: hypothetical protein ABJA82_09750 [Myxococcales bacterium]